MRHLFARPWLTQSRRTPLGIAVVAIVVFGAFAFLKAIDGGREPPRHRSQKRPRVQALPGNELLRDLPLELNAVGTLSGHGFHPLKAQLTLSNH